MRRASFPAHRIAFGLSREPSGRSVHGAIDPCRMVRSGARQHGTAGPTWGGRHDPGCGDRRRRLFHARSDTTPAAQLDASHSRGRSVNECAKGGNKGPDDRGRIPCRSVPPATEDGSPRCAAQGSGPDRHAPPSRRVQGACYRLFRSPAWSYSISLKHPAAIHVWRREHGHRGRSP